MTLDAFLPAQVFAPLVVFARLGSALMLLPGFGEVYVPQRWRLLFALLLALLLAPVLPGLPLLPGSLDKLVTIVGSEIVIGLFLGTIARLMLIALEITGNLISLQLGLSAAQVFNPMAAEQSSLPGAMLMAAGMMVILATDTHHLMLHAIVDSYTVFAAGILPSVGDLSNAISTTVGASFRLGLELSAPFIVVGTVFLAAMGLLGRLVPQLQIFFVAMPVQILGGLAIFGIALAAILRLFAERFAEVSVHLIP